MRLTDIHTHTLPDEQTEDFSCCLNWMIGKERPDYACISAGIHPWFIEQEGEAQLAQLKDAARAPEVKLIGEAGLDKRMATPLSVQLRLFREQALLAETLHKPLLIHCVKAWQEMLALHKELRPSCAWIVHGFRGKGALAEQLVKHGFYLSFGEHFQREALQAAWPDRLLVESDESPLPLSEIYGQIASALQVTPTRLATQTECNLLRCLARQ